MLVFSLAFDLLQTKFIIRPRSEFYMVLQLNRAYQIRGISISSCEGVRKARVKAHVYCGQVL